MSNDDDDHDDRDEKVGYGRPPKKHQFKRGQSGCPSGGHAQRKLNKKKQAEAEKEKEKQQDKQLLDLLRKLAREEVTVTGNGRRLTMPRIEATLRQVLNRPLQPNASPKDVTNAIALYKHAKLLDPAPAKARSGVLVVYPVMEQDEWEAATEGELLPKDPLHGIPGAEGLLDQPKSRGTTPDDEED